MTKSILYVLFLLGFNLIYFYSSQAIAEKRALLIGISGYDHIDKLENPVVDIENVRKKLENSGFKVTFIVDKQATRIGIIDGFEKFTSTIKKNDEVFVYYSGHGIDISGNNLIVPVDSPSPSDIGGPLSITSRLIEIRPLMTTVEDREPAIQIWIIDACRDNPYVEGRPFLKKGGLKKFDEMPTNSFIMFSANYTQTALDKLPSDPSGSKLGSPFSRKFVELYDKWKDRYISEYAREVRKSVIKAVQPNPQFPVFEDGIIDQWCFIACKTGAEEISIASLQNGASVDHKKLPIVDPTEDNIALINKPSNDAKSEIGQKPVVFVGKSSAVGCQLGTTSDLYPFGCEVLQDFVGIFIGKKKQPKMVVDNNRTLTAKTSVFLRLGLPKIGADGTNYGCKARTVRSGDQLPITQIYALKYAGDTFYWAQVDDEQDAKCREANWVK